MDALLENPRAMQGTTMTNWLMQLAPDDCAVMAQRSAEFAA
jgi:hypothetical protein